MSLEMGAQRTERTDNFALHSLPVTFRPTDMAALVRFFEGVAAGAVSRDRPVTISADRATSGQHNTVFRI